MPDLYAILTSPETDRATLTKAVVALGRTAVVKHLKAAGLDAEALPDDPDLLAELLLSLHRPEPLERLDKPRTIEDLAEGRVYASDPPTLVRRFGVPKPDGGMAIVALHRGDGPPRLVADVDLPPNVVPGPEPVPHEAWPDIDLTPGTIEVGNERHLRVDIKVVFWIPYHANTAPLPTRRMPAATGWEDATMTQEMRMGGRAMLATGNPTPPDGFANLQEWAAFRSSKEYRGYLWRDLYVCCPNEHRKVSRELDTDAGYTPAQADVPEDPAATLAQRLAAYHGDHQNIGSIATGLAQSPGGGALAGKLAAPVAPDQYRDAVVVMRKLCPPTNETYSQGELHSPPQVLTGECLSGSWELFVRVGKAHNLLSYAATGKLLRFQGGVMTFKLCCDGKLKLSFRHSAIPSFRVYVNNHAVGGYDMLTSPWSEVEKCFYAPTTAVTQWSSTELENALGQIEKAPPLPAAWEREFTVPFRDGCPGDTPPSEWLTNRL
ncbi:hypothetical protein [Phenylobacterium sp. J367]|uniref:hypothetical protein n=1 Tax=Phenylobacterium sp. J367 TaxID=2898435 RepID=UPI002150C1A0|nr:hypothetical protein [Phenylobacterium sp. J367]MCR5879116.1 hypothetical protein [Phenylobacterium sp. J367]